MRTERKTDAEARVVVLEVTGDVGDRDLLAIAEELGKAPDVAPDFSFLIDMRKASGRNVTRDGVEALARVPLVFSVESRRAVVVPSALGFGMARMYELLRHEGGGTTHVFRDYEQALRWVKTGVL